MFEIREAGISDIPLIRELTYRVWPQTYASILSQEQIDYMLDMMYSPSSLVKQMNDECQFLLVYEENEPVGFASFQHLGNDAYKLHKIYVVASQQGKGTGRFAINFILNVIREKKGRSLELQVNLNNPAKSFYEKLGFYVAGQIKLDIGKGFFMNDYIMKKDL